MAQPAQIQEVFLLPNTPILAITTAAAVTYSVDQPARTRIQEHREQVITHAQAGDSRVDRHVVMYTN